MMRLWGRRWLLTKHGISRQNNMLQSPIRVQDLLNHVTLRHLRKEEMKTIYFVSRREIPKVDYLHGQRQGR